MNRNKATERQRDNRSRKPSSKNKSNNRAREKVTRKEDKDIIIDELASNPKAKYNALHYYLNDVTLIDNASQLSFQSINGITPADDYKVPTIMRIFMNPSPGLTYQGSNVGLNHPRRTGINMAAMKLFNMLSMKSGRNMQYAPQDVGTAILAMSQVLAMHSYVHRLFASVNVWNTYNRMYPRAIITAMGIDYDDFVAHYADYRTRYNALCAAANQIPFIINIGYLEKCMTQFSYIFTDDESPLSQTYIYVPDTTWIMDETSYSGGTILRTTQVVPTSGVRTFADLMINVLRPMVDALLESSTMNLVYADLLNLSMTSNEVRFTQLNYIVDGEATLPIKNDEALVHIHNMTSVGRPDLPTLHTAGSAIFTPYNDVYPDTSNNALVYNACRTKSAITTGLVPETILFDSPVAMPDPETRIEISRYVSSFTNNTVTVNSVVYLSYVIVPDYYVTVFEIIQFDPNAPVTMGSQHMNSLPVTTTRALLAPLSQFDWHPIIRTFNPTSGKFEYLWGDMNFWTSVDTVYLERINELIFVGLFSLNNHGSK